MPQELDGGWLVLVATVLAVGVMLSYWPKIKRLQVPRRPVGHQLAMVLALVLAVWGMIEDPGLTGWIAAIVVIGLSVAFLFTTLMTRTPDQPVAVRVGEPALDFTIKDADGNSFTLSEYRGQPVLLHFFRGHW